MERACVAHFSNYPARPTQARQSMQKKDEGARSGLPRKGKTKISRPPRTGGAPQAFAGAPQSHAYSQTLRTWQ